MTRNRHGLSGARFQRTIALDGGGHVQRDLVVRKDDSYVYTMSAEHADPRHKEMFDAVVESAQPIPRAARAVAAASRAELFSYWD